MLKKIAFTIYAIVIFVMAMATIIEKTKGTPYVLNNVYGSWWFTSLWALLAISGIIYIVRRKLKKVSLLLVCCHPDRCFAHSPDGMARHCSFAERRTCEIMFCG